MMSRRSQWWSVVAAIGLATVLAAPARAGHSVYLALGDSITFGVGADDSATDVSNGDRGYVGRYADRLQTATGTRPAVINLAISGETSSSFFGPVDSGIDGPGTAARNTHYLGANATLTQEQLMLQTIQQQLAAGNTIDHVSLTLGANDLFLALARGDDFGATLAKFVANETKLLTEVRTLLPTSDLILLNYYNPYQPFLTDPNNPYYTLAQASAQAIPLLNGLIAQEAAAFQGRTVDVYSQFPAAAVLAETYITQGGNVHPTNAGYDRITAAIGPALVPEPASLILISLGLGSVVVLSRWQPRQRANGVD